MRGVLVAGLLLAVPAGCGDAGSGPAQPPTPPYQVVTDVRQTMAWILEPAADRIWDSAGTIITAEGQRELAPTTDAGWEQVRNSAALVAETGNLLMMPGRAAGPEWLDSARALVAAGERAMAAAEIRDPESLFDAGGQLYQACLGCHEEFLLVSDDAASDPAAP
jgi:hypothetical protein